MGSAKKRRAGSLRVRSTLPRSKDIKPEQPGGARAEFRESDRRHDRSQCFCVNNVMLQLRSNEVLSQGLFLGIFEMKELKKRIASQ
jgi:hypothetical protein